MFGPMCFESSIMKDWQNLITSRSDFPLGLKSAPPLPEPIGRVVKLFLKVCSNPRNFRILKIDRVMKPQATFVRPDGIVELNRDTLD